MKLLREGLLTGVAVVVVGVLATAQEFRPEFEVADIHAAPVAANGRRARQMEGVTGNFVTPLLYAVRGGRFELSNATIMDLMKVAYGVDGDAVVGGPGWITSDEDRFDVIAKPPAGKANTASIKAMLQSLLADRFKLVAHFDTKPMRAWVLSKGPGEPKLKVADNASEPLCRIVDDNERVSCRNMTMDGFTSVIRAGMITTLPVVNSTGIEGAWNFDLQFTVERGYFGVAEGNPLIDAVSKQLGLRLELQNTPQQVLVVDGVNRQPTPNIPNVGSLLPPDPVKFEVASIRACPEATIAGEQHVATTQLNTGCRPLQEFIALAYDRRGRMEGAPGWLRSRFFAITAKSPIPIDGVTDNKVRAMLRNLLEERFKMAVHYAERSVDVYEIISDKPKLMKADPSGRTGCKVNGGAGFIAGLPSVMTCQNVTLAQLAEQLGNVGNVYDRPGTRRPVVDSSGIAGAWDLTLTYRQTPRPRTAPADSLGDVSIFDAFGQLGLKLRGAKHSSPVFVIDHIEETPTEN
jgi:uncharacterized protein (TIGR03435 family)